MARSPQRRFTVPLGSGRSARLGAADPRMRRDSNARVTSVDDPFAASGGLTASETQALIDASIASMPAAEVPEVPSTELEYGVGYPDIAGNRWYTTFGVDGAWESVRHRPEANTQTTGGGQTGTVPSSLTVLRSLSYTDIDPIPVP